jgi:hypothetical protein
MVIFNSYVSLPEGISQNKILTDFVMRFTTMTLEDTTKEYQRYLVGGHVPARKGQKQEQTGGFMFIILNSEVVILAMYRTEGLHKGSAFSLQERERVRYRAVERGAHM